MAGALMKWSTRDLGLASYLVCSGEECCGIEVQRDQFGRSVGFFVFEAEPAAEQIRAWVNRTSRVEPQALLYAMRGLKQDLFREMEETDHV